MIKKIFYIIRHRYNPYNGYIWDLLTERKLKYRVGECVDCIECCKYSCGYACDHADLNAKRCTIYDNRSCNVWFPISQKELDYFKKIKGKSFKCKFSFTK